MIPTELIFLFTSVLVGILEIVWIALIERLLIFTVKTFPSVCSSRWSLKGCRTGERNKNMPEKEVVAEAKQLRLWSVGGWLSGRLNSLGR